MTYVGEILDECPNGRQILIFIDVVFNCKYLPLRNFKRILNIFIFRHSIAVSITMSQVGHNVHNVTPRVHIMVEKVHFIAIVR